MHPYERRHTLLRMLTEGRTLARIAAQELGVSIRTIYRDVSWLRKHGYVVASVPGPRGGAWLSEHSKPAPQSMSTTQLREAAMHLSATGADPALVDAVLSTLPPRVRRRVEKLIHSVRAPQMVPSLAPEIAERIELAVEERWPLAITWNRSRPGRATRQTVLPQALRLRHGGWVLEALDQRDGRSVSCPLEEAHSVERSYRRWIRDRNLSARYRYRRPDDPPPRAALMVPRPGALPRGAIAEL